MTEAQKNWLDSHRREGWRAVGQRQTFAKRGMLHPDGAFEPIQRGVRPSAQQGSFEVGVLKQDDTPGQAWPV